jgi:3-oxoacyl-[acyl-carrier protein] reductase
MENRLTKITRSQHVLITGGSRGIGRAIVTAFAEAGYVVSFIYNESEHEASELAAWGKKKTISIIPFKYDIADVDGMEKLIDDVTKTAGPIDILVNNAGIKVSTEFLTSTPNNWDKTMSINLRSVYFMSQVVARRMTDGGKIINIASQAGVGHVQKSIEYGISKAGIIYMTKSLAKVLAPKKITVNALSPGRTYTDMTRLATNKAKEQEVLKDIPLKKINSPEDVASIALFLASAAADNITGQSLAIDGGECIA